jgi:hypothetical protein
LLAGWQGFLHGCLSLLIFWLGVLSVWLVELSDWLNL